LHNHDKFLDNSFLVSRNYVVFLGCLSFFFFFFSLSLHTNYFSFKISLLSSQKKWFGDWSRKNTELLDYWSNHKLSQLNDQIEFYVISRLYNLGSIKKSYLYRINVTNKTLKSLIESTPDQRWYDNMKRTNTWTRRQRQTTT